MNFRGVFPLFPRKKSHTPKEVACCMKHKAAMSCHGGQRLRGVSGWRLPRRGLGKALCALQRPAVAGAGHQRKQGLGGLLEPIPACMAVLTA